MKSIDINDRVISKITEDMEKQIFPIFKNYCPGIFKISGIDFSS
jgi:hypothetical protein